MPEPDVPDLHEAELPAPDAVARSPVTPAPPVGVLAGWEVSLARPDAPVTLADWTPLTKSLARGPGQAFGSASRDGGALAVGWAPGQTLLLSPPGSAVPLGAVDLTSALVLLRLSGPPLVGLLAKVCAVDLAGAGDGAVVRSSVARVAATLVRDDRPDGTPSYLVACDRSLGAYLWDALMDAGREFGIAATGIDLP